MAETLKEWIVSLGWDADATRRDQTRFEQAMEGATLRATLLGDVIVEIARKVTDAVTAAATQFDNLFFAAQRAHTTARTMHDFPLLIKQYGGSAQEAQGLLETAGRKLRENAANISILNQLGFGKNAETGELEIQQNKLDELAKLSDTQITTLTGIIGIPEQPILLMRRHIGEVTRDLQAFEDFRKTLGLDVEKAAANGNAFQTAWRSVQAKLAAIVELIGDRLQVALTRPLEDINKFLKDHAEDIGKMIKEITDALAAMLGAWVQDFEGALQDPTKLNQLKDATRDLGHDVAVLAASMASLVHWLARLIEADPGRSSAIANYLGGFKGSEDYDRGRQIVNRPTADEIKHYRGDVDATPRNWTELGKKAWNATKEKFGFGAAGSPTPKADAPPAAAGAPGPNTAIFGDSIGAGLAGKLGANPSNTRQGKPPDWVLNQIINSGSLAGKDVVISSGASNAPRDAGKIAKQIEYAIARGADPKRITVLGVGSLASARGNYPGASAEVNATLEAAAKAAGARFQPLPAGTDVHPDYAEVAKSLAAAPPATAPPPPAPWWGEVKPFAPPPSAPPLAPAPAAPWGQLQPFTAPPVPSGAWAAPSALGGRPPSMISAPVNNTIHVDGTGDPHAVAGLVNDAQKSVNADMTKMLETQGAGR